MNGIYSGAMSNGTGENSAIEARRYRVISLIGEGGFGRVYRANLEGAEGFRKEVAIKLLHAEVEGQEGLLSRFRDEARILGLIRDRAIVNVDPPTRFGGRWAIVMEYIDGCSASALLDKGPVPPTVAVEIVAEVARALDKVWNQPGPDGQPLNLMHRDIKPQNIQITASGEVKILDFGIARARFEAREAKTSTGDVSGTVGYIAPERIMGEEVQESDVFSLGVVLHQLVTGRMPGQKAPVLSLEHEQVIALAKSMRVEEPERRPKPRELERKCRDILRTLSGPSLRDWAEKAVVQAAGTSDQLVGSLLTETKAAIPAPPQSLPPTPPRPTAPAPAGGPNRGRAVAVVAAGSSMALLAGGVAVVLVVVAVALGVWFWPPGGATPVPEPVAVVEPEQTDAVEGSEGSEGTGLTGGQAAVGPVPSGTDGVAVVEGSEGDGAPEPQPVEFERTNDCELIEMEVPAVKGDLSAAQKECLLRKAADPGVKMTDREKHGRVLLVDARADCDQKRGCDEFVERQKWYFEHISQADPDMTFAYAQWVFDNKPRGAKNNAEVLKWTQRALDEKARWSPTTYVARVDKLLEMRAKVRYAMWSEADKAVAKNADVLANDVRTASLEWMNNRLQLGRDAKDAEAMCASAMGSLDRCRAKADEGSGTFDVLFVSIPMGARVTIDGVYVGNAPRKQALAEGGHQISIEAGEAKTEKAIEVGRDKATRHEVDVKKGTWKGTY